MVDGEADVGDADLPHVGGGALKGVAEHDEALGGHDRQQALLVAEVVSGGGVRDTRTAGQLAQAPSGRAGFADGLKGCVDDDALQIAVVVGRLVDLPHLCVPMADVMTSPYLDIDKIESLLQSCR
jgi:hypothetical protein